MVVDIFAKFFIKKCHPQPNQDLTSSPLHALHFHVSKCIDQLALEFKPEPESKTLSLSWLQRCFGLLPFINKAFAKLLMDKDYPMSQWEVDSIEEYLNYTMSLLELLNSISSSLSHLGQATLSLAHGLSLILIEKEKSLSLARKYLKAIQPSGCLSSYFGRYLHTRDQKANIVFGMEWIVHEGAKEMKSIGFWVCGVLLSCLYGDCKLYMELRKTSGGFESSVVAKLDFKISEIKEMNNGVAHLVSAGEVRPDAVKELQRKL